jgi:hypothetical protein
LNDSDILATGGLCEALLASDKFRTVVAQYEMTIASDFLATKAEDKARREELYASLWGARGLLEFMELNARAATAIRQPQPPIDSTTDPVPYDDVYGEDWRAEEESYDY